MMLNGDLQAFLQMYILKEEHQKHFMNMYQTPVESYRLHPIPLSLARAKSHHLNRYLDQGGTLLFKEGIASLVIWILENSRTDAELAYWLEKFLIFHGTRAISHLVWDQGSTQLREAVVSQDEIGWVEPLHGKVSIKIAKIQDIHCKLSDFHMTGVGWMKHFIGKLLQISHLQWLYHNFTLHDKTRGYL